MRLQDIDVSKLHEFIDSKDLYFVKDYYPFIISKLDKEELPINLRITDKGIEWFTRRLSDIDAPTKRYPLFDDIKEARLHQHKEKMEYLKKELQKEEKEFNEDKDLIGFLTNED